MGVRAGWCYGDEVHDPITAVTVAQVDTYSDTHQTVHFNYVHFITRQLILNKAGPKIV